MARHGGNLKEKRITVNLSHKLLIVMGKVLERKGYGIAGRN
jgi:hypothetical protein